MNSCHKVVRSIRNITLKLCADCAKQLVRSRKSCGETNNGLCFMISHQLPHRFLAKNKTIIMPQPPLFTGNGSRWFPKPKTPMKGKCFARIEKIKEKSKLELLPIPKNAFQKYFKDWKKCWHKSVISDDL